MDKIDYVFAKIKLFDGKRFDAWKFRVENFLEAQDVLSVLSSDAPTDATQLDNWTKMDRKAKNIIISLIDDDHLEHVRGRTTAKAMWTSLNSTFGGTSMAKQNMLRSKLDRLKYQIGSDMKSHLMSFDEIVRDLTSSGAILQTNEVLYYLFKTFPEEFQPLITALENVKDDNLTIDYVKSRFLNEEIRQNQRETFATKDAAFATFSGECYNCHKKGHKSTECTRKSQKKTKYGKKYNKPKEQSQIVFCVGSSKEVISDLWILDSGSTRHVTTSLKNLKNVVKFDEPLEISTADINGRVFATHKGDMEAFTMVDGKRVDFFY